VTQPVWLQTRLVLALHDMLIAEHGGPRGVRDAGLLDAALFSYGDPDLPALAAAYAAGIIKNHPFVDGNKRTGFAAAATFLDRNGLELTASEAEATRMTLDLASGSVAEEEYGAWLRENSRAV